MRIEMGLIVIGLVTVGMAAEPERRRPSTVCSGRAVECAACACVVAHEACVVCGGGMAAVVG